MATQEEMSRYFWSASTNCPPVDLDNHDNRALAHDVIAPVTMHLEDKLAIYA
jgi:hypothetical protein